MDRRREPLPFRRPEGPAGLQPGPVPVSPKRSGPPRRRVRGIGLYVGLACAVAVALMLAPSIQRAPDGPLIDRARSDCITIGSAILRFQTDTGLAPRWFRASDVHAPATSRVMVIVGPGRIPREVASTGWTTETTDELNAQMTTNGPGYAVMGPSGAPGWNGPYLAPGQIGPDPWNHRYMVNVGLLSSRGSGSREHDSRAVWVLSAGPNGIIETTIDQPADRARTGGDDIVYRIQ